MKYKLGLFLSILVSAAVYAAPAFAAVTTVASQISYNTQDQFFSNSVASYAQCVTPASDQVINQVSFLTYSVLIDGPFYLNITESTGNLRTILATSTNAFDLTTIDDGSHDKHFATWQFNPFLMSAGHEYCFRQETDTSSPMMRVALQTGTSQYAPASGFTARTYHNTLFNAANTYFSLAYDSNLVSPITAAATPVFPVLQIVNNPNLNLNSVPVTFTGTYTGDGNANVLAFFIYDGNNTLRHVEQYPISGGIGPGQYSFSVDLGVGSWHYTVQAFNTVTGLSGPLVGPIVYQTEAQTQTPTVIPMTIASSTLGNGLVPASSTVDQLVQRTGLQYATTTDDWTHVGFWETAGYNLALKVAAIIVVPPDYSLQSFQSALNNLKAQFPFSIFFNFNALTQSAVTGTVTPQTVTLPATAYTPTIPLVASSTIADVFGVSAADQYQLTMKALIWTFLGFKIILHII